jgi:hypothetical protein
MYEDKTTEGITEDYVWYQARLLTNKMNSWGADFDKLVGVMEARHKEQLKIIRDLLDEIQELKRASTKPTTLMMPNMEETLASFGFYKGRYWVDLTAEEIGELYRAGWSNNMDFARAIEAKVRELNETPV